MKRRLSMVLLLLAAGATVNVAVAWGTVIWWQFDTPANLTELSEDEATRGWDAYALRNWERRSSCVGYTDDGTVGVSTRIVACVPWVDSDETEKSITEMAHGLPFRSLRRIVWSDDFAVVQERGLGIFGP